MAPPPSHLEHRGQPDPRVGARGQNGAVHGVNLLPALKPSKARVDAGHVDTLSWWGPDRTAVAAATSPGTGEVQLS